MTIMLKVDDLSVHYGVIQAVKNVSFEVNEGEVVSLIGANGAGKTSILRTISGLVRPSGGKIEFLGQEIQKAPARKIVASGLSQVPEGRHVFSGLTVMENLEMGAFLHKDRDENQKNLKKVFDRFPRLEERKNQDAATLSGGETFLASLALALSLSAEIQLKGTAPLELFFLDEGFGTLDDNLLEVLMSSLEKIHNDKLKIGLISHVESVKQRVPVKLIVTPAKSGICGSTIKIEHN